MRWPGDPDRRWRELFPTRQDLEERVGEWQAGEAVPAGVADALRVARALLVHSYYVYEFSLVAATWGLLVLEASLRDCLGAPDSTTLKKLIAQASERGLITSEEAEALHGARGLRNRIVHGSLLPTFDPQEALGLLDAIHAAITDIYGRASEGTA